MQIVSVMAKKVQKLLTELLLLIVGVLIALLINNWKENLGDKKYLDNTLLAIHQEIEQSKEEVEKILPLHANLIDSLNLYLADESKSIMEIIQQAGGVQSPQIKNIGLRFFITSKAELISYDIISDLTDMEDFKLMLEKKFDRLMDYTYGYLDKTDKDSKMKFVIYLLNVIDSESNLLELYETYLNKREYIQS